MKRNVLIAAGLGAVVLSLAVARRWVMPTLEDSVAPEQSAEGRATVPAQPKEAHRDPVVTPAKAGGSTIPKRRSAVTGQREELDAAFRLSEPERLQRLCGIVKSWGESDPQAAADYLLGLPPGPERTAMLQALAAVWALVNPRQAAEVLLAKLEAAEKLAVAGEIAACWAGQDPLQALGWLQGLKEDDDFRETTAQLIYSHWAESDPAAAATHVLQSGSAAAREEMNVVLARWVESDVAKALGWYHENLTGDDQWRLAAPLALTIARQDEKAAEAFLLDFKDAAEWSGLAKEVAAALASTNPDLAGRLAATMSPGAERDHVLHRIRRLSVNAAAEDGDAGGSSAP